MADTTYVDSALVSHTFEAEDIGGGKQNPRHALGATDRTTLNAIKTACEALSNLIAGGKIPVADSTIAAYVDQLEGYVDGLEGYVDGLETLITSSNTKLDQVHTDLSPPSGGPKIAQKGSIGSGADVQFDSQAVTRGLYVKNVSQGGQTLWVATSATPTATNSWLLAPGETSPFIEATNVTAVYMRASASSGAAAYLGM